jgi:hypothetical protein
LRRLGIQWKAPAVTQKVLWGQSNSHMSRDWSKWCCQILHHFERNRFRSISVEREFAFELTWLSRQVIEVVIHFTTDPSWPILTWPRDARAREKKIIPMGPRTEVLHFHLSVVLKRHNSYYLHHSSFWIYNWQVCILTKKSVRFPLHCHIF